MSPTHLLFAWKHNPVEPVLPKCQLIISSLFSLIPEKLLNRVIGSVSVCIKKVHSTAKTFLMQSTCKKKVHCAGAGRPESEG